ncbi:MAG: hypothetical protein AB8D52_03405 [Gammaproteobacteria bacterium]
MIAKTKLYSKLDSLEAQLVEELIPHLKTAAKEKNDLIFCVSNFNPFPELKHKTDKQTEELVGIGAQILSLREKLGESSKGSIAERICWYCREWGKSNKHDRKSSTLLAKQFLEEIECHQEEQN